MNNVAEFVPSNLAIPPYIFLLPTAEHITVLKFYDFGHINSVLLIYFDLLQSAVDLKFPYLFSRSTESPVFAAAVA